MIAVLKQGVSAAQLEHLKGWLSAQGLDVHVSRGKFQTIIGLVGDTSRVDVDLLQGLDIVESVTRITEPYQERQPEVPPGRHRGGGRGRKNRRRALRRHRRALLGGDAGADYLRGAGRAGRRSRRAPGRCLQAPHLALRLSGAGQRRHRPAAAGPGRHRPAHHHRDYERHPAAPLRRRGHHPGGRAEHAELRPPARSWGISPGPCCSSAAWPTR